RNNNPGYSDQAKAKPQTTNCPCKYQQPSIVINHSEFGCTTKKSYQRKTDRLSIMIVIINHARIIIIPSYIPSKVALHWNKNGTPRLHHLLTFEATCFPFYYHPGNKSQL
uniref:Uncharacterized protein n=1 Tax=Anopheles culicifacies TaxID=139723 RepID=A0A182M8Z1_9DIPT